MTPEEAIRDCLALEAEVLAVDPARLSAAQYRFLRALQGVRDIHAPRAPALPYWAQNQELRDREALAELARAAAHLARKMAREHTIERSMDGETLER